MRAHLSSEEKGLKNNLTPLLHPPELPGELPGGGPEGSSGCLSTALRTESYDSIGGPSVVLGAAAMNIDNFMTLKMAMPRQVQGYK